MTKTKNKFIKIKSNSINKNCTIKPTKLRTEFEILIRKLGYIDRSAIHPRKEKIRNQINYTCQDGSAMGVFCFLIPFLTKKSYIYIDFKYLKWINDPYLELKIKTLCNYIKLEEKTRIGEVGWEVIYTKNPDEFTMKEKVKIIFDLFQKMTSMLKEGAFNYNPRTGDILASRPYGPKINEGFTNSSIIIGTNQRGRVAQRFGFGETKQNEFQYARYDENKNLIPT
jgi:hypothetical protein